LKNFIARGRPGAYLRVVKAGTARHGDAITVECRPDHDVGLCFRALTGRRELLPRLLAAGEHLDAALRDIVVAGRGFDYDLDGE
jgi:MOSC domain-containing protein YiiM